MEETSVEDLAKATLGNLHAAAMSENGGGDSEQPSRSHALTDALGTEAGSGLTGRTGPIIKVSCVANRQEQKASLPICNFPYHDSPAMLMC